MDWEDLVNYKRVWEGWEGSGRVQKCLGGSKMVQEAPGEERRAWEGLVGSGRVLEDP